MVCEEMVKELERRLKRKLTPEEKKLVEERMHHSEIYHTNREEELICA